MKLLFNDTETYFKDALLENAKNIEIYIASAFFSNSKILIDFIKNNCTVKLIIRLNKGTSASELEKLIPYINSEYLEIRFFNDECFHPKFYIFGNKTAFVGSSNLTYKGLAENQEMNIQIEDALIISNLKNVFNSYWEQAKKLSIDDIHKFKEIYADFNTNVENNYSNKIKQSIGLVKYKRKCKYAYEKENLMFYCTGEGIHRNFDDYVKYSFISAGQKKKDTGYLYSSEIKRLKLGTYFFAYQKRENNIGGYIGFGKVVSEAVPIDEFKIDGKKLYEMDLIQPNIKDNHDNEACEWVVKVEWIVTLNRNNAVYYKGIFSGARHTVCKINKEKHKDTIDFLFENFQLNTCEL